MPGFTYIPAGKKVRVVLMVRGPRTPKEGKHFKKELVAILKRNAAQLLPPRAKAAKKKAKR